MGRRTALFLPRREERISRSWQQSADADGHCRADDDDAWSHEEVQGILNDATENPGGSTYGAAGLACMVLEGFDKRPLCAGVNGLMLMSSFHGS